MRFILGALSGLLGMLVGWSGLAYLIVILSGPDRDGGVTMGAFFDIGPIGGAIGFIGGVLLFARKGITREQPQSLPDLPATGTFDTPKPAKTRISRPFATVVLIVTGGLAWSGWYEFIRSPYLSHGAEAEMTIALQFRLPPGMTLPEKSDDIDIDIKDGQGRAVASYGEQSFGTGKWYRLDGGRHVLLASAELDMITYWRTVRLKLPQVPEQTWMLGLDADPYPIPNYTAWRMSDDGSGSKIEMRFRLTADRCSVCAFDNDRPSD